MKAVSTEKNSFNVTGRYRKFSHQCAKCFKRARYGSDQKILFRPELHPYHIKWLQENKEKLVVNGHNKK